MHLLSILAGIFTWEGLGSLPSENPYLAVPFRFGLGSAVFLVMEKVFFTVVQLSKSDLNNYGYFGVLDKKVRVCEGWMMQWSLAVVRKPQDTAEESSPPAYFVCASLSCIMRLLIMPCLTFTANTCDSLQHSPEGSRNGVVSRYSGVVLLVWLVI